MTKAEKFAQHLAVTYGVQLDQFRHQQLVRELDEFAEDAVKEKGEEAWSKLQAMLPKMEMFPRAATSENPEPQKIAPVPAIIPNPETAHLPKRKTSKAKEKK